MALQMGFFSISHMGLLKKLLSRSLLFSFYFSVYSDSAPQTVGRDGIEGFRHGWRFWFLRFIISLLLSVLGRVNRCPEGMFYLVQLSLATELRLAGAAVGIAE